MTCHLLRSLSEMTPAMSISSMYVDVVLNLSPNLRPIYPKISLVDRPCCCVAMYESIDRRRFNRQSAPVWMRSSFVVVHFPRVHAGAWLLKILLHDLRVSALI